MLKSTTKNTSLYSMIGIATDNNLTQENEDLNKQICYEILRSSDGPKIAAKIMQKTINKALVNRQHQTIWYSILLLDVAVKSTDSRFCAAILAKEFIGDLIKIKDPKYAIPDFVIEKLDYILDDWEKSLVSVEGHHNLVKIRKIPKIRSQYRQGEVLMGPQQQYPVNKFGMYPVAGQQHQPVNFKSKIMHDVDVIETNINIFSDMLSSINPETVTNEEAQFMEELHQISQKMQTRLSEAVTSLEWEDVTAQLLQLNDKINRTTERYKRLMAHKAQSLLGPNAIETIAAEPESRPSLPTASTEAWPDVYDIGSVSLESPDQFAGAIGGVYDSGSLPGYDDAVYAKIKKEPIKEPNLIDFSDAAPPPPQRAGPKLNLLQTPTNQKPCVDLLMDDIPELPDTGMTADDFDQFISSISTNRTRAIHPTPDDSETYAPPLYDEAFQSPTSRPQKQ